MSATRTIHRLTVTPQLKDAFQDAQPYRLVAFDPSLNDLSPREEPAKTAYADFCAASAVVAGLVADQLSADTQLVAKVGTYTTASGILFMSASFSERQFDTRRWVTPTVRRLIPTTGSWDWRVLARVHGLFLDDMAELMS